MVEFSDHRFGINIKFPFHLYSIETKADVSHVFNIDLSTRYTKTQEFLYLTHSFPSHRP